jgi:NRPS condensation-like uncharacterized protein
MIFDFDYFNKLYQEIPLNIIRYHQNTYKAFEKLVNMYKADSGNTTGNTDTLPANGHDMYNYLARYKIANFQIQTILTIDGRLDFDKLTRAVRLSVDAEPVLGCRLIEADPPYWKRLDNIDKTMFCSIEETNNLDESVKKFLESPLSMDKDPMVKIKLLRSSQNDALCIKINHACCENGVFVPNPSIRSRKDQDRLFSKLGIADPETAWIPGSEISTPTWGFPWKQAEQRNMRVAVSKIANGQFDEITVYGKAMGATINELILTAFYRAMLKMGTPIYDIPMVIPITVDLRRYLPNQKTEAIRNFSGSVNTLLSMEANETFSGTLSRVVPMMQKIKNECPGLQSAIGLERVEKSRFKEECVKYQVLSLLNDISSKYFNFFGDKCVPILSNLGYVSKSLVNFGKNVVTNAYMVPPVIRAPGLLLLVSSYNGIMTLSVCYYESIVRSEDIERLLDNIKNELTEGCKL